MKKIDLHCHTSASDGLLKPEKLLDLAVANELSYCAITDHDTVDGINEAIQYSKQLDVLTFIPGIEFSVDYPDGSFHLVGLEIDHRNEQMNEDIKYLKDKREKRGIRIVEDLNKHGIEIKYEDVNKVANGASLGRPHIARVLLNKGYGESLNEIFKNFMVKGKPGYIKKEKISLRRAIELIRLAGGVPIIAHPVSLNFKSWTDFESILQECIELGIRGIEVYAHMHTDEQVERFMDFANKYNLIISGGSDYHGDKDEKIGYYGNERIIPFDIINQFV